MKRKILKKIEDMHDKLMKEWNVELDNLYFLNAKKEDVEHNMDIIEGKGIILEQLKEYIEKM